MKHLIIISLLLVLTCGVASAASMGEYHDRYKALTSLEEAGDLTKQEAASKKAVVLKEAQAEHEGVTAESLLDYNKHLNWHNAGNVLKILAGFTGFLFLIFFTKDVLIAIFTAIPAGGWELLAYAASISAAVFINSTWVHIPACLVFGYILGYTLTRTETKKPHQLWSLLTFLAFGAFAVLSGSTPVGFLSIISLMAFFGFSIGTFWGGYVIGWTEENQIGRGTWAAFIVLVAGIFLHLNMPEAGPILSKFAPLKTGALFMGVFVYFVGMLILSTNWYKRSGNEGVLEVLNILSGIAALLVGFRFEIPFLATTGVVFFCLYLLTKYCEYGWKDNSSPVLFFGGLTLLLGGLAYGISTGLPLFMSYL